MKSPFNFFKHAQVYSLRRIADDWHTVLALHEHLKAFPFVPCGPKDSANTGWLMQPTEDGEIPDILHRTNDVLLTVVKEVRQIPAAALKNAQQAAYKVFEFKHGRWPKKAERDALKDAVFQELLPRAFPTRRHTQIWVDLVNSLVVVDAASAKVAEDALAMLRKTLGSLPVIPVSTETPIELTLTEWIKTETIPAGLALSTKHNEAHFQGVLEGSGKVSYRKAEVLSDATTCLLDDGNVVTSLGLEWTQRVNFVLDNNAQFKKLSFSDELTLQNEDIAADPESKEDMTARKYADFTLMADELRSMISGVYAALGGMAKC